MLRFVSASCMRYRHCSLLLPWVAVFPLYCTVCMHAQSTECQLFQHWCTRAPPCAAVALYTPHTYTAKGVFPQLLRAAQWAVSFTSAPSIGTPSPRGTLQLCWMQVMTSLPARGGSGARQCLCLPVEAPIPWYSLSDFYCSFGKCHQCQRKGVICMNVSAPSLFHLPMCHEMCY